jgi:DNA-binding IclR family transcriptional regulator
MALARRSPPTARVTQVLDFFVARQGKRFGLSEIARNLNISKPTCLGIVSELASAGYLVRDPILKSYGLGPALIAAGRVAQSNFAASALARRYLLGLSEQFAATCTASAVVGEQIMVLERTGPPAAVKLGQLYPFAPPVGLMYVLWGPDSALTRWLRKPATLPMTIDEAHLRQVVSECRIRGYLVESLTPAGLRLHTLMAGLAAYDLPEQVRELVAEMAMSLGERIYLDTDLATEAELPVSLLAAPTYDRDGNQELVLTLHVGQAMTGPEIARRGAALTSVANAVTAALGSDVP